jgi:GNAT superfamily N-acetyltransferase
VLKRRGAAPQPVVQWQMFVAVAGRGSHTQEQEGDEGSRGEAVVGCIGLRLDGAGLATLDRLAVVDGWRRRGVGAALVRHAEGAAAAQYLAAHAQQQPPRTSASTVGVNVAGGAVPLRVFANTVDAAAREAAVHFWRRMGYAELEARSPIGKPSAPLSLVSFTKSLRMPEPAPVPELEPEPEPRSEPQRQAWGAVDLSWAGDLSDQRCEYEFAGRRIVLLQSGGLRSAASETEDEKRCLGSTGLVIWYSAEMLCRLLEAAAADAAAAERSPSLHTAAIGGVSPLLPVQLVRSSNAPPVQLRSTPNRLSARPARTALSALRQTPALSAHRKCSLTLAAWLVRRYGALCVLKKTEGRERAGSGIWRRTSRSLLRSAGRACDSQRLRYGGAGAAAGERRRQRRIPSRHVPRGPL